MLLQWNLWGQDWRADATGDHYDLSSALIKSIRGSDADAGLYWLARMLEGGEDIRYLCRRLVILASEDIGNADPNALVIAVSAMQACEWVGLPECQLTLSQTVAYLALAPKSNAATVAINEARREVAEGSLIPVPIPLRDAHYAAAEKLGNGEGYLYRMTRRQALWRRIILVWSDRFIGPSRGGMRRNWGRGCSRSRISCVVNRPRASSQGRLVRSFVKACLPGCWIASVFSLYISA